MGWSNIETLWYDSNINGKESSRSKDRVEDTVNIVDLDDGHIYRLTWYDVISRGTLGGGKVQM